jgi:REP element-mobilizing transposase RayT
MTLGSQRAGCICLLPDAEVTAMARRPRNRVVNSTQRSIYHCTQRCVRRAFLCGRDPLTGNNYEHRRLYIQDRLEELTGVYALNLLNYAILSNHLHLLLRTEPGIAKRWSAAEIVRRWWRIHPERDKKGRPLELTDQKLAQLCKNKDLIRKWRKRLCNLSWFMKDLAEWVARKCNREDNVPGRFWQGRFGCSRIEDDTALLACAVYVDLNLIRAGLAETPETSLFSSIHLRIQALQQSQKTGAKGKKAQPLDGWLAPVQIDPRLSLQQADAPSRSGRRASDRGYLEISFPQYLELVDWTGRQVRKDKQGAIPQQLAPILQRLGVVPEKWSQLVCQFGRWFPRAAGTPASLKRCAQQSGQCWIRGIGRSREAFTDQSCGWTGKVSV